MEQIKSGNSFHDLSIECGAYQLIVESDFGLDVYNNQFIKKIEYYNLKFQCPHCNCIFKKIKLSQNRCFKCEIIINQYDTFCKLLKMVFYYYYKMPECEDKYYIKICMEQLKLFECFYNIEKKSSNKHLSFDEIIEEIPKELIITHESFVKLINFFTTMKYFIQNLH